MATYYWVGGTGTWDTTSTTNWAASSGGAGGAGVPALNDAVIIDGNSGSGTITSAAGVVCITLLLNSSTLTLALGANLTVRDTFTLTLGTLNVGAFGFITQFFASANSNARTLAFSGGFIRVTGTSGFVWSITATNMTVTGTSSVEFTGAATTSRTLNLGSPTEAQSLNISIKAGTDTLTMFNAVRNLDFTGFSGTWAGGGLNVYGSLTLSTGMTVGSSVNNLSFLGTSGPYTITCAGKTIDQPTRFAGVGGTWQFADAFSLASGRTLTLTSGTLDASNQNASIGSFALAAGTKTLTLGSGTWTVLGGWDANTNVTNLTVSPSTGTISMTSASSKSFAGGGLTWPTLNQGGAGALTVQQSNTFANITNTVQPATITLTSGTTQTVTDFDASGTAGNLITLNSSTPGSRATLLDASGTNSVSYVSITDIAATGAAIWEAYTSNGNVDGGNNVGWVFTPVGPIVAAEYPVEMRSFTEKRRF